MAPPLPTPPDTQQNHHAEILDDEDGDMDGEVEHNTDRCQLFEPFDITEEPTSMISTKYPSQDTALRAALLSSELDVSDEFNSQSIQKLKGLRKINIEALKYKYFSWDFAIVVRGNFPMIINKLN